MKNTILLGIAITLSMFSCNESSHEEVKDAKENISEAKEKIAKVENELHEAVKNEAETEKTKQISDWGHFRNESDSSIVTMENELKKMEVKIEKSSQKDKQKMKVDYTKSKNALDTLKEKLRQKNVAFKKNIQNFDNTFFDKNQLFIKEFKHEMDELGKAIKGLFKDNVK
jgi:flagellum-specific peptidoglycan hydrolase FlgJ